MGAAPEIECFMIHETRRAQRWLRRYSSGPGVLTGCRHDHWVFFDQVVMEKLVTEKRSVPHKHPLWPKMCSKCGYQFDDDDPWAVTPRRIYTYANGEKQCVLRDAPPGAMWYADWMQPTKARRGDLYVGPDGRCLVVKTPGGDWIIDGPSRNGDPNKPGWKRDGNPPLISAEPTFVVGTYRGRLTMGRLVPLKPGEK